MTTHSSSLAWRIPWTKESGGLQLTGSHRVGHDWSDLAAAAWPYHCFKGCSLPPPFCFICTLDASQMVTSAFPKMLKYIEFDWQSVLNLQTTVFRVPLDFLSGSLWVIHLSASSNHKWYLWILGHSISNVFLPPVFLPGESQGQRSLVGCHLWGRTESDMTEAT